VIVENNSTQPETFTFYQTIEAAYQNVHVVYWKEEFNYSKINNFGAQYANGEYLLLLNNDTKMKNSRVLDEMLGYCMRDDVGIVGARLYYDDMTIQHAGVIIGFGGIAGHAFIGMPGDANGYFSRIICAQDYSAVTAACLMTKKDIFMQAGGLTEELKVAFNDIDFCLKVRKLGKLVVYNPYAELFHFESKSRGLEDTPEKKKRFRSEVDLFNERWKDYAKEGDPYYNVNLSLDRADFAVRKLS
jgi:GT2 family glycosyltransferase